MISYNKIVNPKTDKLVRVNSSLGKKILLNYINVLNKQRGGATVRFSPAMFTHMCHFGDTQCVSIASNWLGIEKAYIKALLWESSHAAYITKPRLAVSRPRDRDGGVSAEASLAILQKHADAIEDGGLDISLEERQIYVEEQSSEALEDIDFDGTLYDQFNEVLKYIKPGYATLLYFNPSVHMGHAVIIGKFEDGRRFIIDPQGHEGIISGATDDDAHTAIIEYIQGIWEGEEVNLAITINGPVLDASNYIPIDWRGVDIESRNTPGYGTLPPEMRLCQYYDGSSDSCPLEKSADGCPYIHDDAALHLARRLVTPVCHFWNDGLCEAGDSCPFSHPGARGSRRAPMQRRRGGDSSASGGGLRRCAQCENDLSTKAFSYNQRKKGPGSRCKECVSIVAGAATKVQRSPQFPAVPTSRSVPHDPAPGPFGRRHDQKFRQYCPSCVCICNRRDGTPWGYRTESTRERFGLLIAGYDTKRGVLVMAWEPLVVMIRKLFITLAGALKVLCCPSPLRSRAHARTLAPLPFPFHRHAGPRPVPPDYDCAAHPRRIAHAPSARAAVSVTAHQRA